MQIGVESIPVPETQQSSISGPGCFYNRTPFKIRSMAIRRFGYPAHSVRQLNGYASSNLISIDPLSIQIAAVGLGGMIGGIARFWVTHLVSRWYGDSFPWGTLLINVSGALVIGLLAAPLAETGFHAQPSTFAWLILSAGMIGSYTTVSAFSLQTFNLIREGRKSGACLYVAASLGLCLAATTAGYMTGNWLLVG